MGASTSAFAEHAVPHKTLGFVSLERFAFNLKRKTL
jgi:hypothetical protein